VFEAGLREADDAVLQHQLLNAETRLGLPRLHPIRGEITPLHSGLALSDINEWLDSVPGTQGVFTAYDLSWMDLDGTELVVLSGCVTGSGPQERWRGLVDLRSAAFAAGARNVVVALHPVPDVATTLMMLLMYECGLDDPTESLRSAQNLLRSVTVGELGDWLSRWSLSAPEFGGRYLVEVLSRDAMEVPFKHPKYWASIVCFSTREMMMG
jgi:hypothetical protein